GTVAGGVPAPTASAPVPVASTTGSAGESGTGGTAGPTTVTPTGPETTSAAAVTRRAPPPLYQCSSADGTTAFSPDPGPVGRCTPVAESALCDGWRARMAELDAQTRASDANLRTSAQNELERVTVAYNASTCVVPAGVIPAS
ncbi:MAG TPA: hypothetical protein VEY50_00630, partial [Lysobacter sp.]|nr:hypothetical protein [Lysobacter sp.]